MFKKIIGIFSHKSKIDLIGEPHQAIEAEVKDYTSKSGQPTFCGMLDLSDLPKDEEPLQYFKNGTVYVETGNWYVDNTKGSKALVFVFDIRVNKFARTFGFNESGDWDSNSATYDLTVANFMLAEKEYVDNRISEYADLMQRKSDYSGLFSHQKYTVGKWYGGVAGKRIFRVCEDNKDLTYKVLYFNKHNEVIEEIVRFDPKRIKLNPSQTTSFLKDRAVKRGFRRKSLRMYNNSDLFAYDALILSRGRWTENLMSSKEAEVFTGVKVV